MRPQASYDPTDTHVIGRSTRQRLAKSQKLPLTRASHSSAPTVPSVFPTLELLRSITQYATLSD